LKEYSSHETLELFRKAEDIDWLLGIPAIDQQGTQAADVDDLDDIDCRDEMPRQDESQFYAPNCAYRTLPLSYPRASVSVRGNLSALSTGYLFTAGPSGSNVWPRYNIIMTSTGDPVYFREREVDVSSFAPTHRGQLLWWHLQHRAQVLGPDYEVRHEFSGKHGEHQEGHEFQLMKNGNGLIFIYDFQLLQGQKLRPDVKWTKGVVGVVIQEITADGDVAFEWRSWDHLPLSFWESHITVINGIWDVFHANSLEEAHDGNILLSMRTMSQIIKINRDTGEVLWRLGGRGGNFRIVNDTNGQFRQQHDVRDLGKQAGANRISLFDNAVGSTPASARGVEYDLFFDSDGKPTEARLASSYDTGI